jgi:hypothetical protein
MTVCFRFPVALDRLNLASTRKIAASVLRDCTWGQSSVLLEQLGIYHLNIGNHVRSHRRTVARRRVRRFAFGVLRFN